MASQAARETAAEIRRRKVRKGTHSCWECRRRKIKCQYDSTGDSICLPCQSRGTQCQSQELVDESRTAPAPDRRLAQRLGRLEELMEKLMDRMKPEPSTSGSSRSRSDSASPPRSASRRRARPIDVLDGSVNEDTPVGLLLGLHNTAPTSQSSVRMTTPDGERIPSALPDKSRFSRYDKICKALHAQFPAQRDIDTIMQGSGGGYFVTTMFHCFQDFQAGNCEPQSSLRVIPPVTAHPTVLARRLLQLSICMQQLSPAFNRGDLTMDMTLSEATSNIISIVTDLVTSNDELIGTSEGLQSLVLLGIWHANAGNLRKAWLTNRRALSLAQLMGIDRGNSRALKFADPTSDPTQHASPAGLWYRIVSCDRFMSLLLGLCIGTWDNSFATEEAMVRDTPYEKLAKHHAVIAARVAERNLIKASAAFTMTQEIDFELERASQLTAPGWWQEPILEPFASLEKMAEATCVYIHQIRHFDLLILLHLPYMLRDPSENRYEYSRITCVRASREVLKRFISFRTVINSAFSCRHIDYSALIAAMTLLLSYLGPNLSATGSLAQNNVPVWSPRNPAGVYHAHPDSPPACSIHEDRKLVESVRERMAHVAIINDDKLSQESADIISQLLPVLDARTSKNPAVAAAPETGLLDCLHLTVPYLGTVSIRTNPSTGEQSLSSNNALHGDASGKNNNAPYHISIPSTSMPQSVTIPIEQMDFSAVEHVFMGGNDNGGGMSFMQLDPQMLQEPTFPELTAEADDWALQGVDTTYWSMLNGGL